MSYPSTPDFTPLPTAVAWTGLSISAGHSISVAFAVTVDIGLPDGTALINSGYSVTCTQWLTPIAGSIVTTTVHSPVLIIGKRADGTFVAGKSVTYTLTITNSGPVTATYVVVSDVVPAGAGYVSGGNKVDNTVIWTIPIVGPSGSTAQVTFTVTTCQSIVNDAYRVVTSAQGIVSGWGAPLTTVMTTSSITVSFTPASVCVGLNQPTTFTAASTTNGGPIVAWGWDLGDGTTAISPTVSHSYTTSGTYTVTLTVTDICGYSQTIIVPNAVRIPCCVYLPIILKN